MVNCPKCGSENSDNSKFCKACGENLNQIKPIPENKNVKNTKFCSNCGSEIENTDICPKCGAKQNNISKTKFCSNCGKSIDINAEICPHCGVRVMGTAHNEKNPTLSLVLSFLITGLGQIYNGQVGKGFGLLIGVIICAFLFFLMVPLFIIPVLWIYSMYDAYTTAKKINEGFIV